LTESTRLTNTLPSPNDSQNIGELLPNQEQVASSLLGNCFLHDPWFDYFFGSKTHSELSATTWFCNQIIKYGLSYGRIWGNTEQQQKSRVLQGCAVWQPPQDAGISFLRMLSSGFAMAPFYFGVMASTRAIQCMQATEDVRNSTMKNENHWYLFSIGVEAAERNKGKGTKLMQPILRMADAGNIKCYTDTASTRCLTFFQRLGFKVVRKVEGTGGRPTFYALLRMPNPEQEKAGANS